MLQAGIRVAPRPCLTAFVLSLNGSAITLSRELWEKGVRDAASLRVLIEKDRSRKLNFGAALEYSTQNYDLRQWLSGAGINPDRDIQITYVPSPIVHRQLERGHLDGYCVGEPWNSLSVADGHGWIAATSAEISPRQIEKVLLVLRDVAEAQPGEHLALVAALIEASAFCEARASRPELVRMLAQPAYLDLPEEVIARSLVGPLQTGNGERSAEELVTYQRRGANVPDRLRARHLFDRVAAVNQGRDARTLRPEMIPNLFREDLYRAAERSVRPAAPASGTLPASPETSFFDSPLRMAVSG